MNLQENFQAVVHYDLAWNPTRHEQREGRVDRFGQRADVVRAVTMYGRDNQIDGIVLEVLLRKHQAIRKATGVSVPVPDNTEAVVEALMEGLLLRGQDAEQLSLDLGVQEKQLDLYNQWDSAAERERVAQTKYAQHGIKPEEVGAELRAAREALGTNAEVAEFVEQAIRSLRSTVTAADSGYTATLGPLPLGLRDALPPCAMTPCTSPRICRCVAAMRCSPAPTQRWRLSHSMSSNPHSTRSCLQSSARPGAAQSYAPTRSPPAPP